MNFPTLQQIAAKYGVDPNDTGCTGMPAAPDDRSTAQKMADKIKAANSGKPAAGR